MKEEKIILFDSLTNARQVVKERQVRKILVDRKAFGITRISDSFFVFDVACPHMEYDLTTGKVSPAGTIVCPWHNYQFLLDSGKELDDRCRSLQIRKAFSDDNGKICFNLW